MSIKLINNWEQATQAIADEFKSKYFKNYANDWWVNDDIGGVFQIGDYFFGLDRMIEALRYGATRKKLLEYYDYELELAMKIEKPKINFKNFIKYGFI